MAANYSDAIVEAIKETGRLVVFGVISAFITAVTNQFATLPQDQLTVFLTLALRAIDKWVHEEKSIDRSGILPF